MCSEVNDNVVDLIECIGVDDKRHWCIPWKNVTMCEIPVVRKKTTDNDIINHYCCSICDAYQDERDYT